MILFMLIDFCNIKLGKKFIFLLALLVPLLLSFSTAVHARGGDADRIPEDTLLYTISIPLQEGAGVTVAMADGAVFPLGNVVRVPETMKWPAFTASKWGKPGHVAATAVNAIHLLARRRSQRGQILSILPAESFAPAAGQSSSVVIEGKGGHGVFGAWAPPVGVPVHCRFADGTKEPLYSISQLVDAVALEIAVPESPSFGFVDIENWPGGRVICRDASGTAVIARVVRPVGGVGRFGGSRYQVPGRLRANHPGVICVSTSPQGSVGGFQVIPLAHAASSPEMASLWRLTQWLVVGTHMRDSLVGSTPLFSGRFVSGPGDGEQLWNLWATYGRRSLVLCRTVFGPWKPLPVFSGRHDTALSDITHLRLYVPSVVEPLVP
ncbi:MAG: hypothetical protein K9L28_04500 [Synergistales bacterium]|nr:hypothetical protein [Synergistales bacterium]